MKRVEDKVTIVTGGGKGIGRAAAIRLAEAGALVAVLDLDEDAGREVVEEIASNGGHAAFWKVNVADSQEVSRAFDEIAMHWDSTPEEGGHIDVLVNNAGIAGANKPTDLLTEADWDKVFDVNVKGVFYCTKYAIPYMRVAGGGSIINLSSIYGIIGAPDIPPYHASKGAVRLMSKTDALLYAEENIRVNSVHPGYIWTPLVEDLGRESEEGVEAFRANLDSLHPIGHVGEPDDIAYGIVYLASDESKFVTGSELVIDGGYTAR
ncbi:MAG: glucose 1-dehydrogenase [Rhodothermales bacterium]